MQRLKKIFIAIVIFFTIIAVSNAQELISSGSFDPVEYIYSGKENYKTKKSLTHALAYSYSKDVSDILSTISYSTHYKIIRVNNNGFETIIRLGPENISGHTGLMGFDFSKFVLPRLKSISLFMYKDSDLVYVKNVADLKAEGKSLYFKFKHQRFAKDWRIELRKPVWEFSYSEEEFNKAWKYIADYQLAADWINAIDKLSINNKTEEYILKTRLVQLLEAIKKLEFYEFTKNQLKQDPQEIFKQIDICIYKYQKDLELLQDQIKQPSLTDFVEQYFSFENYLLELHQNSNRLYGNLYDEFNPKDTTYFCPLLTDEVIADSDKMAFENLYQKYAMDFINKLIQNKQTPEALFQIQRFETFCQTSDYLVESATFKRFKARAVYDIYLSYIQVSKQALEHDQIDMAITYLDKANDIQQNYSSEIINNILVEKEMRNLIKKAMNRYQTLLDEGKTESARRVKEGIIGLMKKLGLESNIYHFG